MNKPEGATFLEPVVYLRDLSEDNICEWDPCPNPATYWLVCPICSSKELQCDNHTIMVQKAPIGETVMFNCTCLHTVQQMECGVEKI
jgi:hypothetical protein